MPAPTPYEEAQKYINNTDEHYINLLGTVRAACERVEGLERQAVKAVYSRGEKQKNRNELKETWKLPKKLLKLRQEQDSNGGGKKKTWYDIPDVIGVTIVVYYPDQIKFILQRVVSELAPQGIELDEPIKVKTEFGYHADHAIFVSKRGPQRGLRCEVQCKTMLHDSWATKMHDLTYKPNGYLEPRLALLMQAFGDTLERVERQSEAIRDMIMEKWNAESQRRRITHGLLFLQQEEAAFQHPNVSNEAKEIRALIEKHRLEIKQAANAEEPIIASICEKIDDVCTRNLHEAWVLAALIASFRPKPDLVSYLALHAEAWLAQALDEALRKDPKTTKSILAVPLAFVAAGNIDLAVDCYEKILSQPSDYNLNDLQTRECKFNHANALIERHYYDPDESRDGPLESLRERVKLLLDEAGSLGRAQPNTPEAELEQASVKDTNGFMQIVFASGPEHLADVSAGIDLCNEARLVAKRHNFSLGEQYCDLHLRLGWRKILELEATTP